MGLFSRNDKTFDNVPIIAWLTREMKRLLCEWDKLVARVTEIEENGGGGGSCSNDPTQFVYAGPDGNCTGDPLATRVEATGESHIKREIVVPQEYYTFTNGVYLGLEVVTGAFNVGDTIQGDTSLAEGVITEMVSNGPGEFLVIIETTVGSFVGAVETYTNLTVPGTGFGTVGDNTAWNTGDTFSVYDINDLGAGAIGTGTIIEINGDIISATSSVPILSEYLIVNSPILATSISGAIDAQAVIENQVFVAGFELNEITIAGKTMDGSFHMISNGDITVYTGAAVVYGIGYDYPQKITVVIDDSSNLSSTSTQTKDAIAEVVEDPGTGDYASRTILANLYKAGVLDHGFGSQRSGADTAVFWYSPTDLFILPVDVPNVGDNLFVDSVAPGEVVLKWGAGRSVTTYDFADFVTAANAGSLTPGAAILVTDWYSVSLGIDVYLMVNDTGDGVTGPGIARLPNFDYENIGNNVALEDLYSDIFSVTGVNPLINRGQYTADVFAITITLLTPFTDYGSISQELVSLANGATGKIVDISDDGLTLTVLQTSELLNFMAGHTVEDPLNANSANIDTVTYPANPDSISQGDLFFYNGFVYQLLVNFASAKNIPGLAGTVWSSGMNPSQGNVGFRHVWDEVVAKNISSYGYPFPLEDFGIVERHDRRNNVHVINDLTVAMNTGFFGDPNITNLYLCGGGNTFTNFEIKNNTGYISGRFEGGMTDYFLIENNSETINLDAGSSYSTSVTITGVMPSSLTGNQINATLRGLSSLSISLVRKKIIAVSLINSGFITQLHSGNVYATFVNSQVSLIGFANSAPGVINTGVDNCTFRGVDIRNIISSSGAFVQDCHFENNAAALTIELSKSYTGRTLGQFDSGFDYEYAIDGLTTLDLTDLDKAFCSIFKLTSANATETIDEILGGGLITTIRLYPESGLAVTLTGTAIGVAAAGDIVMPVASLAIDGTTFDSATFATQAVTPFQLLIDSNNYI
jgi:hypothetical protein